MLLKNKKYVLISLGVIAVLGALFTALASNMLFDDLFNKGVSFSNMTLVVSLPAVSVATMFVLAVLYLIRTYKHPDCIKRISRLYMIIALVFGVIGLVGSILGGALIYGTFTGSHPFPGYLIIFMILNILIILANIYGLVFCMKKIPEDESKVKINFLYVLKTIGWVLFIGMVFNRFGMFLGMPAYVYTRNLYYTFPTYLYLLLPLYLGVVEVLYIFGILRRGQAFMMGIIGLALDVAFFGYTVAKGLNDTAFISSISQIYPIDRMATLPIEILLHFLSFAGVGAAIMVQNRPEKAKKEEVKEEAPKAE